MATAGWALGSLLGYLLFLGLVAFVEDEFGITVAEVFPVVSLPVALVAVVVRQTHSTGSAPSSLGQLMPLQDPSIAT